MTNTKVTGLSKDLLPLITDLAVDIYQYPVEDLGDMSRVDTNTEAIYNGIAIDHAEKTIWVGWLKGSLIDRTFIERENFVGSLTDAVQDIFEKH